MATQATASDNIVSLATGKALSDNTPTASNGVLLQNGSSPFTLTSSLDELEDVSLIVRYYVTNAFKISGAKLTLSRGASSTDLTTVTTATGVNSTTVTISTANVDALRSATGGLLVNLVFGTTTIPLAGIEVQDDVSRTAIANNTAFYNAEAFNNLVSTANALKYSSLNNRTVSVTSNAALTFNTTSAGVSFFLKAEADVTLVAGTGVTITGVTDPSEDDILLVEGMGTMVNVTRIGNSALQSTSPVFLGTNVPIFDSLWTKTAGQPTADSAQSLVFIPDYTGSVNIRLVSGGSTIVTGSPAAIATDSLLVFNYTITGANWTTLYTANTANTLLELEWEYSTDAGTTWNGLYTVSIIK